MRKMIDFLKSIKVEALMYVFIGGCTTVVNFGVYTLLLSFTDMNHNVVNAISIIVSILFAYVTNKHFVFKSHCTSRGKLVSEAVKFIGGRLFAMLLELGGVAFLVDSMHVSKFGGKAVMQVVVIIVNYIVSKLLVFKGKQVNH